MSKPLDYQQRLLALDTHQSFIVQAPAGSGKTSLLTQRFLRLLTQVNSPEEILAITFTVKAAAEMHHRIMASLAMAQQPRPDNDYDGQLWDIATQVLQHDADNEWHLLQNPSRLRVQTIDSLCASLTRQLPVTAHFGSPPSIRPDASALYQQAARQCLEELDDEGEVAEALQVLLQHLDNHLLRAETLVSGMLASRDQWLRHLMSEQADGFKRATLEKVLQSSIKSILEAVSGSLDDLKKQRIKGLLAFASSQINDRDSLIAQYGSAMNFDTSDSSALENWQMLADFLLTKGGTWRKQANAALGFPPPSTTKDKSDRALFTHQKQLYTELLTALSDDDGLLEALNWIYCLPSAQYSEQQWQFIQALMLVLPRAVAHLRLVFQQCGEVDFCEVSISASRALHDSSGVTDIGLKLDYQLQHILLDEFQDTSETQFMLLKDLVAGWQTSDGRSLFLVGDPMQSIYRFRQAEVGLFLKTKQHGLGEVRDIQALDISVNFRSQAGLVNWVNSVFKRIMPQQDNVYSGAISYKDSQAFKDELLETEAVCYYPHADRLSEGQSLLALIQRIQQQQPEDSIGVLVRGRKSLSHLVLALNEAGVPYQASDIDPLNKRQTVVDLMSLTQAYLQAADRVAWLSVLRAPWCGLSLSDMQLLLDDSPQATVWDLLQQGERLARLSADGQHSLAHLITHIKVAFNNRERLSLHELIRSLWSDLLGPDCLSKQTDLIDAQRYFDCLHELDTAGDGFDLDLLQQRVEKLYAASDVTAPQTLQIMTIHKAKGLEFDHVILPGLDRRSANDDKRLLAWLERPSEKLGESELLIAPLKQSGADNDDPIAQYLTKIEQQKSLNESQRLLYVAATRAKKQLHLSFCLNVDDSSQAIKTPAKNTLLGLLWPCIEPYVEANVNVPQTAQEPAQKMRTSFIQRLDLKAFEPVLATDDFKQPQATFFKQQSALIEFDWASDVAACVGTVSHQLMQILGERGVDDDQQLSRRVTDTLISQLLIEAQLLPQHLDEAMARVRHILTACLQDKRGRWVLNRHHQDSAFELALSGVIDNELVHCRLDRTFVEEGVRWIIDYKTSRHDDDNKEQFLDDEMARYKAQLERYAQLMQGIDSRPIRLGLYYPAFGGWRSWEA